MAGNDLSFSMLIRLMDGWSGPADKIRQSMKRMTTGAREFKAGFGGAIKSGFSTDAIEAGMLRSERRIGAARQRLLGAAAMAVTLAAPVIQAGNFEEKLIDFANLAEIGTERVQKLKGELDALRKETGQSNIQLLDGIGAYVGKGMGLDDALAAMRATGRAARATKTELGEMANSGFAVMDNLNIAPDQLRQAFDIMAKSGKEGSFELAAMARKFPEITAGAKSLKMDGVDAVASLSAALQIAMKAAGSEDQAATNMTNFLGKITAPDTVKKFAEFGVNIEQEMKIAAKRGTDPLEHMLEVISKMTGGDAFKMGELFADKQVLDFLRAMIPNLEEYKRIKAEALGASGVVDADFERVMKGFNAEWSELKNSVTSLVGSSSVLLPIFTDIMREMRFGVETVAAWTAANPELTATIVKGAAALLAFGVGTRVIGFGFALMQGGLLRTASLFLRFNAAGRNVSVVARALRGAGWAAGGLFKGLAGAARLLAAPLRWGLAPLRWTSKLIPAIPWTRLLGAKFALSTLLWPFKWTTRFIGAVPWARLLGPKFAMGSMILPLRWTAALLPSFAAPLARFIGFQRSASGQMATLETNVKTRSLAMTGSLSRIGFGFLGLMSILDDYDKRSTPEALTNDQDRAAKKEKNDKQIENLLYGIPLLGPAMRKAYEFSSPAPSSPKASEPTKTGAAELAELTAYQNSLRAQISALEAQIANIKDGPLSGTITAPMQAEIEMLRRDLAAISPASGKGPDVSAAMDQVVAPITQAIREGQKQSRLAPETSIRPQGRPDAQAYTASQPNVTVESKFESNPKVDVKIDVSMPIHITREQKVDNAAIAKAAGRQAGAETERAVRRGLDDAANME